MDAPERGALMLVRIIAIGLIGWALTELALYLAVCKHKNVPVEVLPCLCRSLPLLVGVGLLIKARTLAEWISNFLDD
jgi:hypothetical protein